MPIAMARLINRAPLVGALAAAALVATSPVHAQEQTEAEPTVDAAATVDDTGGGEVSEAQTFTETLIASLSAIAADAELTEAERDSRFEETLLEALSVEAMAIFALGRENWESAAPEQLESYLELFPAYITRVFAAKIGLLADRQIAIQTVEERPTPGALKTILAQTSERATGEPVGDDAPSLASLISVMSQVLGADGRPRADVQWLLEQSSDKPLVFDVVAEGTSSLFVEREKIRSIAARDGLDALLTAMSEHVE